MTDGPDLALVERFSAAQEWTGYGFDPRAEGLRQRVEAASTWNDLSAGDREFIADAIRRAQAGDNFDPDLTDTRVWPVIDTRVEDGDYPTDGVAEAAPLQQPEDISEADFIREVGVAADELPAGWNGKGFDFDDPTEPASGDDDVWVGV